MFHQVVVHFLVDRRHASFRAITTVGQVEWLADPEAITIGGLCIFPDTGAREQCPRLTTWLTEAEA